MRIWLVALLLLAPAAAAQEEIVFTIASFSGENQAAVGESARLQADYEWSCPSPAATPLMEDVPIHLDVLADHPGFMVTLDDEPFIPEGACGLEDSGSGTISLEWTPDATAPGETITTLMVKAKPETPRANEVTAHADVVAEFLGGLEITPGDVPVFDGDTVKVPFIVKNVGNSIADVRFEATTNLDDVTATAPERVAIPSANQGGDDTAVVDVVVDRGLFTTAKDLKITLTGTPHSTKNAEEVGPTASGTAAVESKGLAVPAPGILIVAPLLAAALRRRPAE